MMTVSIDIASFRESFLEEAGEHVTELERGLLELEDAPADHELLNQIFRAAHSLKGGSASFGFKEIARLTHVLENLLDPMREGKIAFSEVIADLLLRSVDVLKGLVEAAKAGAEPESFDKLLAELESALERHGGAGAQPAPAIQSPPEGETESVPEATTALEQLRSYAIDFAPGADLFCQGMNPILLLRNLGELGAVTETRLDLSELPRLDTLDPERCYLRWSLRLETSRGESDVRDVFAFVEDTSTISVRCLSIPEEAEASPSPSAEAGESVPERPPSAPAPAPDAPARRAGKASTLRVATDKVDRLVDLVGELVISQSMVAQALNDHSRDALARAQEALAEMERNTRELQERVMSVRMVPVGSVFNRFPRLVRDLSAQCGKRVRLEMSGQEIEIDKSIVEDIADPLIHLLRNALDHGIETPVSRAEAGKPEEGVIRVAAFHQGGSVVVEVSDDGRGLDTAKIRQKGLAVGLIRDGEELTEEQIHALIFEPGFSTAATITDVSGRGVGMDVVRRNVDALNGSLTIASAPGQGSSVRIKLPLTLAILEGLSFRIGAEMFVLPLLPIVESIRPASEQLKSVLGRGEVLRIRGESVPLVRLYQVLGTEPEQTDPRRALVVIVETETCKLGLMVDELLGQGQFVVKSLERNFRKVEAVMGATILGTGRIALILDVEGIARRTVALARGTQSTPRRREAAGADRVQTQPGSPWE
jgi:two-component system chemotaxis sensor kinase CheA